MPAVLVQKLIPGLRLKIGAEKEPSTWGGDFTEKDREALIKLGAVCCLLCV